MLTPLERCLAPQMVLSLCENLFISFLFSFRCANSEDAGVRDIYVKEWKLVYSPYNAVFEELIDAACKSLQLDGIVGVNTPEEVEAAMTNRELVAGIVFQHSQVKSKRCHLNVSKPMFSIEWILITLYVQDLMELPKNLDYVIRFPSESRTPTVTEPLIFNWHTNLLYPLFFTGGPRSPEDNFGGMPFYYQDGFLAIQNAIARSFSELSCRQQKQCENGTLPDIKMQRYPYPAHILDLLLQGLETIVSFFILLSFIYPCINTVRFIAIEKERQLKETMKIMGLPSWLHWTSWFVRTMIVNILSIALIVILLKV